MTTHTQITLTMSDDGIVTVTNGHGTIVAESLPHFDTKMVGLAAEDLSGRELVSAFFDAASNRRRAAVSS